MSTENVNIIETVFSDYGFGLTWEDEKESAENVTNVMKETLEIMYRDTKRELKNYFLYKEALAILACFTSTRYYPPEGNPKSRLIPSVQDHLIYENSQSLSDEEQKTLIEKLKSLTEFQCFTVIMLCFEVLYLHEDVIDHSELKKILLRKDDV